MRSSGCDGQRDPARERVGRVRVDADVLQHAARRARRRRRASRRNGIGAREKYIARAVVGGDDFHHVGPREDVGRRRARAAVPSGKPCSATCASAPRTAARGDEGLVALHVDDRVEAATIGAPRDFGDAIGARRVRAVGEDRLAAGALDLVDDLVAVGGDDAAVGDAERDDALQDADDEGDAGEEAERLSGETRRAQSRWDDGERPHVRLAGPRRSDAHAERAPDATFTPVNIRLLA